jgi:DnaJ-class molecular chaperone
VEIKRRLTLRRWYSYRSLKIKGKDIAMNKNFNPQRYGMVVCPLCNGKGFLIMDNEKRDVSVRRVCVKCGGFGAIKKEEEVFKSLGN